VAWWYASDPYLTIYISWQDLFHPMPLIESYHWVFGREIVILGDEY
ncbi:uncharacterized protein METZ01_LOCUS447595, partial [marine metagenome]